MTNKEFLIDLLDEECAGERKDVERCLDIFNEYDWAVFCSQMGDYDHPGERVYAKKVFNNKIAEFTHPSGEPENHILSSIVKHIETQLSYDCRAGRFYNRNFHYMNEEYNQQKDLDAEKEYFQSLKKD